MKIPNSESVPAKTDYYYDARLWNKGTGPRQLNEVIRMLNHTMDGNVDLHNLDQEIVGEGLEVTSLGPFDKKQIIWEYSQGVPRWESKGTGGVNIVVEDGQSFCIVNDSNVDGTSLPQSLSVVVSGNNVTISNALGDLLIENLQISSGPNSAKPALKDGQMFAVADKNVFYIGVPSS